MKREQEITTYRQFDKAVAKHLAANNVGDRITKLVNDVQILRHLDYLEQRWQDENAYEDIRMYGRWLNDYLQDGEHRAYVVRMSTRPFSAVIAFNGMARRWRLSVRHYPDGSCLRLEPVATAAIA